MRRLTFLLGVASLLSVLATESRAQQNMPLTDPTIAEGSKQITVRAERGEIEIGGFGKVRNAYFYDQTFTAEGHGTTETIAGLLPPVWHLEPGERLRIRLENKLDPGDGDCHDFRTNLHVHGLLVSPWTSAASPYSKFGDDVFLDTYPESTPNCAGQASAMPGMVSAGASVSPTAADYEIVLPGDHPSGLFWYHPHPHMISGRQVGGGMAGLIAVGSLWDYAYLNCALKAGPAHCKSGKEADDEREAEKRVPERFLMLKDMQVQSSAASATAPGPWAFNQDPDTALCGSTIGTPDGRLGSCSSTSGPGPWLFPVNGQIHPTIAVSGAGQVWRIGNTSASVTYRLALTHGSHPLCLQVLSRDGVAIAQGDAGAIGAASDRRVFESEVILMPGSRAEFFVSYADALNLAPGDRATSRGTTCGDPAAGGQQIVSAELVTLGFDTGSNPPGTADANLVGDPWPAIDMAGVTLEKPPAPLPGAALMQALKVAVVGQAAPPESAQLTSNFLGRVHADFKTARAPSGGTESTGLPAQPNPGKTRCGPDGGDPTEEAHDALPDQGQVRVVWFGVGNKDGVIPAAAPDRDPARAASTLTGTDDTFELATEIRDATDLRIWPSGPVTLKVFDPNRTDVCLHAGHREVWRLVNLSNETHNFHIHQSKFRILSVNDPYNQLEHEAPWALTPDQVHDVFPIPKYGYVDVEIGFGVGSSQDVVGGLSYAADQVPAGVAHEVQVGRFVFHCHILEHEDGGMMGTIEVLPRVAQRSVSGP